LPKRTEASPFTKDPRGLKVALRLTPGARHTRIFGVATDEKGNSVIRASVTAPPESGKANVALIALLAKGWRLPKTSFSIISGTGTRHKTVLIAGNGESLVQWLEERIRSKNV
tara:strand:+ start:237 stop:575 length:339 start_codon:yes stop_codon:yes gene_type:complete